MAKQYFNWKLAFVLVVATAVFAVAALALHSWQKNTRAEQALPLGEQAYDQGDWQEAAKQLGRYLVVDGSNVSVLLKYADSQLKIRPIDSANIEQAIAAYSAALRSDGGNAEAVGPLIEIYLGRGRAEDAERKARQYLQERDDASVRRFLGVALIQQRRYQEAADVLTELIQEHPDQIAAYETMGRLALVRPEDVNEPGAYWFDEAIRQNPDLAMAYIIRGAFRRQTKDLSGAMADLEHAETLELTDAKVQLRLVGELIGAKAMEKARTHLKRLCADAPKEQGLWQYWADIAVRSGSAEEMQTVAEAGLKALAMEPWDFMPMAVELFIRAGQYDQAQDFILKLKEKNIQPARGAFLEGLLAEQQGQLREAVAFWEQAIALGYQSPQDRYWGRKFPFVRATLATTLLKLGNTQSAMGQLRTLVAQVPTYPGAYLLLARLEAQAGDWEAVLEHTRQLKQLMPEQKEATMLELQARMHLMAGAGDEAAWREMDSRLAQLIASETDETVAGQFQLLRAENAILQRKYDDATTLLDKLERDLPDEPRVVLLRVQVSVGQGEIQEAVSLLQRMLEQAPQSVEAATRLALLYNEQEKRSESEVVITDALARIEEPGARHTLGLFLADLYVSWGQTDRLYEWLVDMAGQFPEDIKIKRRLLGLDRILKEAGQAQKIVDEIKVLEGANGWQWKLEQARVWLRSDGFAKYYTDTVRLLQENLLANPEDQISRMLLGTAYEKGGEMRLALATYTEALNRSLAPADVPIRLMLGAAYEKAGDLPEALATYREAMKRSPDNILVIGRMVEALYRDGQFDAAQKILDDVAQRDLHHADLQKLRLEGDLYRGALGSASSILQEMVQQDPNDSTAQFTLAVLLARQEKFDEALAILTDLRTKSPDIIRFAESQIQIYVVQGKQEQAIQICNDMVDRSKDVQAYTLRARTYAMVGQQDEALADFERAILLEPGNATTWLVRANYYRDLGRAADELEDVKKALSLAPDDLAVQQRALQMYLASGDRTIHREAQALLQRAIETHPENVALKVSQARMLWSKRTVPAIQQAQLLLNQIVADAPNQTEAWELLGRMELAANQPGNAMDIALRGLAHNANDRSLLLLKADAEAKRSPMLAVPTLKELLRRDPNDLDVLVRWARVAVQSERGENTQELVAVLQSRLEVLEGLVRRRCETILAATLYGSGKIAEAETCVVNLMAEDPNDLLPLWAIAELPGAVSRSPRLRALIDDWATLHPDDDQTPAIMAATWVRNRDEAGMRFGETLLRFALQRTPESIAGLHVLGNLTAAMGRTEENAEVNRRILAIDPNNVIAINNLAWFLCEEQGQYQEALTLTNRGLQHASEYLDLIDTRGVAHYRLGNLEEAVKDFERFIQLCPPWLPSLATTRFHLARTYVQMGNLPAAVRQLEQIPGLDASTSNLSAGDQAEAKLLLERVKKGN